MHRILFTLLSCLFIGFASAQITFEPGYIIDNYGEKINCQIKYAEWRVNPRSFQYRLNEGGEILEGTLVDVSAFVITDVARYERHYVQIDRSSSNLRELDMNANPIFEPDTLFLNLVVDGIATLYQYHEPNVDRYFFKIDSSNVEQLVYKQYTIDNTQLRENQMYKQQLKHSLKCEGFKTGSIESIDYALKDLVHIFERFNDCSGDGSAEIAARKKEDNFNLTIRPGLNLSRIEFNISSLLEDYKYDSKLTARIGIEAEYILPFNRNKWSFALEPTFQHYKSTQSTIRLAGTPLEKISKTDIDYYSIEIPFGIRYYMFLSDKSRLFLNAQIVIDFPLTDKVKVARFTQLNVSTRHGYALGAGYKYGDNLSLEVRFTTPRDMLTDYIEYDSDYSSFSFILGYTLL